MAKTFQGKCTVGDHFSLFGSYRVAPNIALIKYWGKYDEELIVPLNSSISITLDCEDMYTETSVELSTQYTEDTLEINGEQNQMTKRIQNMIDFMRARLVPITVNGQEISVEQLQKMRLKITSYNNFPTAAGLASSSSGIACLAICLKHVYCFDEEFPHQITELARLGSGSASRSLYGGIVKWVGLNEPEAKKAAESQDKQALSRISIAKQLYEGDYMKDMEVLILVADNKEKDVGSTVGMKQTVDTSDLLQYRLDVCVDKHIAQITEALEKNDWNTICQVAIKDSNQFHSVCLDTTPPIFYLNETSKFIINAVEFLNKKLDKKIGYTFDAGPNAVILVHVSIIKDVYFFFISLFPSLVENQNTRAQAFLNDLKQSSYQIENEVIRSALKEFQDKKLPSEHTSIKYLYKTKVGSGPIQL
eukprot:TRINITY_DN6198_c0_g1_i2.p1 TRINITY_DN6198_c0_g1~~TRINITY_DN6198_c0_g1_i2.p1  ORF type:complete len:419 (-),score=52.20 TRINITY_DN6198_c0_g1_i2:93-1349(-)